VNRFIREIGEHANHHTLPFPWQHVLTRPLRAAATAQGKAELMSLWAGQNTPLVERRSAAELMALLVTDGS